MLLDLPHRCRTPELMDAEAVPYGELRECLRHLELLNRATGAYRPTLQWLDRLLRRFPQQSCLHVLDVGAGRGDMLRRIARWAKRRPIAAELTAVDVNPWAAQAAAEATPPQGPHLRYIAADWRSLADQGAVPDAIISSLFAHHLDDQDLVRFMRWMEGRARLGWFINDLHRNKVPYAVARVMTRTLPLNRLVVHDAPVSVARGFTFADWVARLGEAGVGDVAKIEWHLPFRLCVGRIR